MVILSGKCKTIQVFVYSCTMNVAGLKTRLVWFAVLSQVPTNNFAKRSFILGSSRSQQLVWRPCDTSDDVFEKDVLQ